MGDIAFDEIVQELKDLTILAKQYQEPEEVDNSIIKNYLEGYQFIFDLYYKNNISNYKKKFSIFYFIHLMNLIFNFNDILNTIYKYINI